MSSALAVPIIDGRLYALGGLAESRGALSWLPASEHRYEPINAFLLVEDGEALLVDTGVAAHATELIAQLEAVISADTALSVIFTRFEGDTLTNLGPIMRRFRVKQVIGGGVSNPFDFFDDLSPEEQLREDYEIDLTRMRAGEDIILGTSRRIKILSTSVRNLTTSWIYDSGTGALFTSDSFGYEPLETPSRAELLVTQTPDDMSHDRLAPRFFTKFDWMLQADCAPLIDNLRTITTEHDVTVICPTHGRILSGRQVVSDYIEATVGLLQAASTNSLKKV